MTLSYLQDRSNVLELNIKLCDGQKLMQPRVDRILQTASSQRLNHIRGGVFQMLISYVEHGGIDIERCESQV